MGCARRIPAWEVDGTGGTDRVCVEELMQAPITVQPGSGGRGRMRRQKKAGERQWEEERRRAYRPEQGFLGRRDEQVRLDHKLCLPLDGAMSAQVAHLARHLGVSPQEFIRDAVRARISEASEQSHVATA